MFKHTTKHSEHSREALRSKTSKAYRDASTILCDDIYTHTFGKTLPASSVRILDFIVSALTGGASTADHTSRVVHTIGVWRYADVYTVRCCFVQHELCSSTAGLPISKAPALQNAHIRLFANNDTLKRAKIMAHTSFVQVSGRLAPYVVEQAGLQDSCEWSYCNAARSRILFVVVTDTGCETRTLSRQSLNIMSAHCPEYGTYVYMDDMACFKVTSVPQVGDTSIDPNKNTAVMVYCDGSFRIQGTPAKAVLPCECIRGSLFNIAKSRTWDAFITSLRPL